MVEKALEVNNERNLKNALAVIQSEAVRDVCLRELKQIGSAVQDFVEVWGRKEELDATVAGGTEN